MDMRRFGLSDEDLRQLGYKVGSSAGASRAPEPGEIEPPGSDPTRGSGLRTRDAPRLDAAWRIWVTSLALLGVLGWFGTSTLRLPGPTGAASADTSFSSARALAQLGEIAVRPRPSGSTEHDRVGRLLVGRLQGLGLDADIVATMSSRQDSGSVNAATTRNVLARIPGSSPTGALLLTTHYDTPPLTPGAGDNGWGVATVLEAIRAVRAGGQLRNDVVVLFTDAHHPDQLGLRAFVESHPWMSNVATVISVEGRGVSGPAVAAVTGARNGAIVTALAGAGAAPAGTSLASSLEAAALGPEARDPLSGTGLPTISIRPLSGSGRRYQVGDVGERVSERTLQHGGRQILALTRALGATDLREAPSVPDRVYLSLPRAGLVDYPAAWVIPLSLGLLVLWGLVGLLLKKRRATRNGVIAGAVLALLVTGLAGPVGGALFGLVSGWHPEMGLLDTALYREGPHVLALMGLAVAVTSILFALARLRFRTDELAFGAQALPLGITAWLTFTQPHATPAVHWPLVSSILSVGLIAAIGTARARSRWSWVALLLLSGVIVMLAAPNLQLVASSWTLREAGRLTMLFALTTLLLLPLMEWLVRPRSWPTPLLALGGGGVLIALMLPMVQGGVRHPVSTSLVYLTDEPVASLASSVPVSLLGADTGTTRTMIGRWLTVPGQGEEWARSWVGDPVSGSTDPGILLLGAEGYEIIGTAPDAELSPPVVEVLSAERAGGRIQLVLDVASGLGGEMLALQLAQGERAELTGVGDAQWPGATPPVRTLVHWGRLDPDPLRVGLLVDPGVSEVELVVLEHHLRPQEVLGTYFFQRPDSLVANAAFGSDRVIQRTVVTVPTTVVAGIEETENEVTADPSAS